MGMYTEIYVNVDLQEDTPEEVIAVLRAMCTGENKEILKNKAERWAVLFKTGSFYLPGTCCANLTYNDISERWSLLGKGDIKNYENEIEEFFEWLMPWVDGEDGDFIGYKRFEQDQKPELIFLRRPNESV